MEIKVIKYSNNVNRLIIDQYGSQNKPFCRVPIEL